MALTLVERGGEGGEEIERWKEQQQQGERNVKNIPSNLKEWNMWKIK